MTMRKLAFGLLAVTLAGAMYSLATAQPPEGKGKKGKKDGDGGTSLIDRMMAFDKNKDGKLTRDEVTDERLHRVFDMADVKKAGTITRADLEALAARLDEGEGPGGKGGPGGKKGKGGFGGPGGFGKGGFGKGGPPRPGGILPPHVLHELELSPEQKKKFDALQKDVDERLGRILTADQMKQLKEMRPPGPPGGFGGPGGGFGPGGGPPGGFDKDDGPPPPRDKGKGKPKGKGRPPIED